MNVTLPRCLSYVSSVPVSFDLRREKRGNEAQKHDLQLMLQYRKTSDGMPK